MVPAYSTMRNVAIVLGMPVLCLVMLIEVLAEEVRGIDVVPDKEKRSIIRDVDAYAQLSENMTLAETRSAAFATARRQAMEMASFSVQSLLSSPNGESTSSFNTSFQSFL